MNFLENPHSRYLSFVEILSSSRKDLKYLMKDTHTVPAYLLKGQTERRGWENKVKERNT